MRLAKRLSLGLLLRLAPAPAAALGVKVDAKKRHPISAACGTSLSGSLSDLNVHTQQSVRGG